MALLLNNCVPLRDLDQWKSVDLTRDAVVSKLKGGSLGGKRHLLLLQLRLLLPVVPGLSGHVRGHRLEGTAVGVHVVEGPRYWHRNGELLHLRQPMGSDWDLRMPL